MPLGSLISAGANIIGGLFGSSSARDAARANAAQAARNEQVQYDFAKNSIRWRVDDAKAAGIHPLYALGAPTVSYAPQSLGATGDTSMANAFSAAGQDLSRAINTTRTGGERDAAFNQTVQALTTTRMGLENELLSSQIAKLRQTPNPPMPTIGPVPEATKHEPRPLLHTGDGQWSTDPRVSNSEEWQKRYGEPAEWAMAPYILWRDFNYHYRNTPSPHRELRRRFGDPPEWVQRLTGERR